MFEDDWMDIPEYEGLYRVTFLNNRPIAFSIKRDKLLDGSAGIYNLSKNGIETSFTERQLFNYVTRNTMGSKKVVLQCKVNLEINYRG